MRRTLLILSAFIAAGCDTKTAPEQENQQAEAGPTKGVDRSHKGQPAPDIAFSDPEGGEIRLAEFEGVPVLVNLWATWCAPCVKELPTLDRLAASHNDDGRLGVIAVSQDMAPQGSVSAFLDKLNAQAIGPYHDSKMALSAALSAQVLPTTVLYDAKGREVWRYVGDLDWTSAAAAKLLAEVPATSGS